jgi:hypothetical protein
LALWPDTTLPQKLTNIGLSPKALSFPYSFRQPAKTAILPDFAAIRKK